MKSRAAGPGILNPERILTLAAGSADARAPDRNVRRLSSTSGAALALWLCQVSAVPQFQGRPEQKRYSASCHGFVESDELAWDLSRDPYKCIPVLGMVTGLARGPPIHLHYDSHDLHEAQLGRRAFWRVPQCAAEQHVQSFGQRASTKRNSDRCVSGSAQNKIMTALASLCLMAGDTPQYSAYPWE